MRSAISPAFTARPSAGTRVYPAVMLAACIAFFVFWTIGATRIAFIDEAIPELRWGIGALAIPAAVVAGLRPQWGLKSQVGFLGLLSISVLFAEMPFESGIILVRITIAFALARGCALLSPLERMTLMTRLLQAMAIFIVASLLAWQFGFSASSEGRQGIDRYRFVGLASSPGLIGYASAIVLPSSLYAALWSDRSAGVKVTAAGLASAAAVTLFLANSRSGIAGGAIGCLVVVLLPVIRRLATSVSGLRAMQTVLLAAIVAAYLYPIAIGAGLIDTSSRSFAEKSTLIRLAMWEVGWHNYLAHPVFGTGLATPIDAYAKSNLFEQPVYYHTALLNYLAKSGTLAALAFTVMVGVTVSTLLQQFYTLGALSTRVGQAALRKLTDLVCVNLIVVLATVTFSTSEGILQQMYPGFMLFFLATATLPTGAEYARLASLRP